MKKNPPYIITALAAILILILTATAHAQEATNETTDMLPEENTEEQQANETTDETPEDTQEETQEETPAEDTEETQDTADEQPEEEPETEEPEEEENPEHLELISITPESATKGDVLLTITVRNIYDQTMQNLVPIVVARGFSTYDTTPIKSIRPGSTATTFVNGNFAQEGDILMTIKLNDEVFYTRIMIKPQQQTADAAQKEKDEQAKAALLRNLTEETGIMYDLYGELESELREKKEDYDTTEANLDDLKKYIMAAQTSLAKEDAENARLALIQAKTEYADQKEKIDNLSKKSRISRMRDIIIVLSALLGTLVTSFTLYELLKKKKKGLYKKIKEIKVSKDTKIIVKKRRPVKKKEDTKKKAGEDKAQEEKREKQDGGTGQPQ